MKLTLRLTTFSLFLAAAAATLEASSLYDTAVLKRQSVPARSYDHAHPKKHSYSAHVKPAQSSSQNSPSSRLAHAYGASETIKPHNPGKCHSVGATGITRSMCSFGRRLEILTIVVVRSEGHGRQWP